MAQKTKQLPVASRPHQVDVRSGSEPPSHERSTVHGLLWRAGGSGRSVAWRAASASGAGLPRDANRRRERPLCEPSCSSAARCLLEVSHCVCIAARHVAACTTALSHAVLPRPSEASRQLSCDLSRRRPLCLAGGKGRRCGGALWAAPTPPRLSPRCGGGGA